MDQEILELYPASGARHRLRGLYLNQVPPAGASQVKPFIYSNFISSLDGRIALPGPGRSSHQVPPAIANSRDWRLFQELAAQADLLITSGRYFRQTAAQEAQAELPVGQSAEFDDLREWRASHGLAPQPDIAVFSASLDIPITAIREYSDRRLYIITGARADDSDLRRLTTGSHAEIITCGTQGHVDAALLRTELAARGYRNVYAIAGPAVLHTLAQGNALDRLYHTTAHCLLGGTRFDTFVRGSELEPARSMPLKAMYFDPAAPAGAGQTFAVYGQ
ncbi:MAG: dihydrofolate reductase family protein [Thiogranum sp.]|nr:dihydrofolate reductase family protein [Thiogranum sp.]